MAVTLQQAKQLEELIHRGLEPDGKSVELSSESDMQRLATLAKDAGIEGADKLQDKISEFKADDPFRFELTSDYRHHATAEEKQIADTSLLSKMVIAANAHLLQQLEAKEGAVKNLEENTDSAVIDEKNDTQKNITPKPSMVTKCYSMEAEEQCWKNYLQDRGYNYDQQGNIYQTARDPNSLKNEVQIVGSSDMAAMRRDYQINYRSDETLGKAAQDTASGQEDDMGFEQENTQQKDETRSPSPFQTTPKPKGAADN